MGYLAGPSDEWTPLGVVSVVDCFREDKFRGVLPGSIKCRHNTSEVGPAPIGCGSNVQTWLVL